MLQSTNPNEYWKLVKKLRDIDNHSIVVKLESCIEDMIKHYEKLNENTDNESNKISDKIKELELSTLNWSLT